MSKLIRVTGDVAERYSIGALRRDNPSVSFPSEIPDALLAEYGVFRPTEASRPAVSHSERAVQDEIPTKQPDGSWVLGWTVERKGAATVTKQIKAEAHRRILALVPEWRQRNLLAQAVLLSEKGRGTWTTEEQGAWDAGQSLWTQIAMIRAASDALEANPPDDFLADEHWP